MQMTNFKIGVKAKAQDDFVFTKQKIFDISYQIDTSVEGDDIKTAAHEFHCKMLEDTLNSTMEAQIVVSCNNEYDGKFSVNEELIINSLAFAGCDDGNERRAIKTFLYDGIEPALAKWDELVTDLESKVENDDILDELGHLIMEYLIQRETEFMDKRKQFERFKSKLHMSDDDCDCMCDTISDLES